jgi:hypothetical protein
VTKTKLLGLTCRSACLVIQIVRRLKGEYGGEFDFVSVLSFQRIDDKLIKIG